MSEIIFVFIAGGICFAPMWAWLGYEVGSAPRRDYDETEHGVALKVRVGELRKAAA
jgi:hypothetical protein